MSNTELELQAAHAFEVEQRIVERIKSLKQAWVEIAADLYEFSDNQLWRHLGYDTFDEWIASPNVDPEHGRRWVFELINLYRQFVVLREVPAESLYSIGPSKLQQVLPAVRRGQVPIKRALADAESLSKTDLRDRYSGAASVQSNNGRAPDLSSVLDAEKEPDHVRCPVCGSRTTRDVIEGSAT